MTQLEGRHSRSHRVRKSRSRRHHRHQSYNSETETDKEEGEGPRVSFVHTVGIQPFLNLHNRYRTVEIKYFKQIFFGTFRAKDLTVRINLTIKPKGYVAVWT